MKRRIPRSQWLPALLLVYMLAMGLYFGRDLIEQGETMRLVIVSAVEVLLITALYFFLRKKEKG